MTASKIKLALVPLITIGFSLVWTGLSRIFNIIAPASYANFFLTGKTIIWHVGIPMALTFLLFFFLIIRKYNLTSQVFKPQATIQHRWVKILFALISIAMLLVALYNLLNTSQTLLKHWNSETMPRIIASFCSIFFVGLTEEVVFRGFALTEFRKKYNEFFSYLYSMLLFGLWHLPNVLNGVPFGQACLQVVSTTIIGSGLYFTVRVTKSLWAGVCLHWLWDFAVCLG